MSRDLVFRVSFRFVLLLFALVFIFNEDLCSESIWVLGHKVPQALRFKRLLEVSDDVLFLPIVRLLHATEKGFKQRICFFLPSSITSFESSESCLKAAFLRGKLVESLLLKSSLFPVNRSTPGETKFLCSATEDKGILELLLRFISCFLLRAHRFDTCAAFR